MKYALVVALLYLFPLTTHASSEGAKNNKAQIKQVFATYMETYNLYLKENIMRKDQNIYTDSMMLITPNRTPAVLNEEKLAVGIQGFLDGLKNKGVKHIKWKKLSIKLLSNSVAIASNAAVRYKENGDIYDHAGATYMLTKANEKWQIAAFTPHDADNVISMN